MDTTRYYFLLASQEFLLHQEPIEEILRERIRHYSSIKKKLDFYFTTNLDFLDLSDLTYLKNSLVAPSAAIISLNPKFINWLKLRVQYGIKGSFTLSSVKDSDCLWGSNELLS